MKVVCRVLLLNIILGHLKRVHEIQLRKERNLSECIGYCFTGLVACLPLCLRLCVNLCLVCLFPVNYLQEGTRPCVFGGRGRVRSCINYVLTKGT